MNHGDGNQGGGKRISRFHGGNPPPKLQNVLKAIRAHADLETRGWFLFRGTVVTIVQNAVSGITKGAADDYVRYLFNVGVLLAHRSKYFYDSDRAADVLDCVKKKRAVLPLDDSSAKVRASQLYQDMPRRREAPSKVSYSLDALPPNLKKVLLALEGDSGILRAGHCGVKRARAIVGSATARNAIEPTVHFLAGVRVLLEDSVEGGSVYWLDRERIAALRAFISNPEWDLPEVNPSDRLEALKKTGSLDVDSEVPMGLPVSVEPVPETIPSVAPAAPVVVMRDPAQDYKWRACLLREEFLGWLLLHERKVVDVDDSPRIAIALQEGDFDPTLCRDCGISPEALRAFVEKCIRVGIVRKLDGTNGHLTLRVMVPLEIFEAVEITERPLLPLGIHELALMKHIRCSHAQQRFPDLESVKECVRAWMASRRGLPLEMTFEYLTSLLLGGSAGAECGFVHCRPEYEDVVVSWAGFEAVDTAPRVLGTSSVPPRPPSPPLPAPSPVSEVQTPMTALPAPTVPDVPPPAQGSLEALRAELAAARAELQSAQARVDELAWRVDDAEREDRARRQAEFAAAEARLNQELQERLAQLRAQLGLE